MRECTDGSMCTMKTGVIGMAAGEKKDMAMKEMQMAHDMMMKKDMKGCADHMGNHGRNALARARPGDRSRPRLSQT
jgi:hypothetical protein